MSKYIDAERLNMEWQTLKPFGVTDTMIENLKWIVDRQPTIEVSEDCISRSALRKEMEMYGAEITLIDTAPSVVPCCDNEKSNKFQQELQQAEVTTEQSSKVGEWIERIGGISKELFYQCSKCYGEVDTNEFDYCPWCGAKMKG